MILDTGVAGPLLQNLTEYKGPQVFDGHFGKQIG